MTGLNQELGSTTGDRMLEAAPDKARPKSWFDHGGKEAEPWGKMPGLLLAVIGGQGVPPRLLSAGFFFDCVPSPHFKMKMKKRRITKSCGKIRSVQVSKNVPDLRVQPCTKATRQVLSNQAWRSFSAMSWHRLMSDPLVQRSTTSRSTTSERPSPAG
jgi:hypothetical protein